MAKDKYDIDVSTKGRLEAAGFTSFWGGMSAIHMMNYLSQSHPGLFIASAMSGAVAISALPYVTGTDNYAKFMDEVKDSEIWDELKELEEEDRKKLYDNLKKLEDAFSSVKGKAKKELKEMI